MVGLEAFAGACDGGGCLLREGDAGGDVVAIDLWTIPVRLDSDPLRAIQRDADAWEVATLHPPVARSPGEPASDISRAIVASLPEGFGRALTCPDRSYEQMEYLLDPIAYRGLTSWGQRERTMPYRVIQGDRTFADHARGGQGILWRYSNCTFLAAAVAAIDALPVAAVRREFSVAEMVDLGVYKAQPNEDDDTAFDRILGEPAKARSPLPPARRQGPGRHRGKGLTARGHHATGGGR